MRVELFGVGTLSESRAITAQKRINCQVEVRRELDRTHMALTNRDGLTLLATPDTNPSRGMHEVNSLALPLVFTVHANTLYSITAGAVVSTIGNLNTSSGDVSMADDGTYLVVVDGAFGYVYNMSSQAPLTQITDGNFTTSPSTVTWQDNYFIVTAKNNRQFQLSQISPSVNPLIWPAVQIGFSSAGPGSLQAGIAQHSLLNLFGDTYAEFWQDAGSPNLPYTLVQSSAQEYGLAAPFSLQRFDNSMIGLFRAQEGGLNISRVSGFSLKKVSDQDIDEIISGYATVSDATSISYTLAGHPIYIINFPTVGTTWMYDGYSNEFSQLQTGSTRYVGNKAATLKGKTYVSDYLNGNIYSIDSTNFTDNNAMMPMEVWSKHIWKDDKYIGISQVQVDIESGVGLVSGQGVNPVCDLQVSKDGGASFTSIGFGSMGAIGNYTTRMKWNSLGAARDWVLKLVITDPVKRVITGASAEVQGGGF